MKRKLINWANKHWPNRSKLDITLKLKEELQELLEAIEKDDKVNIAEELFDVYAMIHDYCNDNGINLKEIFRAKKIIVNNRKRIGKNKELEQGIIRMFM